MSWYKGLGLTSLVFVGYLSLSQLFSTPSATVALFLFALYSVIYFSTRAAIHDERRAVKTKAQEDKEYF